MVQAKKNTSKASKKGKKAPRTALTEQKKDEAFLADYQKLCNKYKRGLQASPAWRFSQDGNDFRLVINLSVQRWPEEQATALNGKPG